MTNLQILYHEQTDAITRPIRPGHLECKCHFPKFKQFALRVSQGWNLKDTKSKRFYYEVQIQKEVEAIGIGLGDNLFPLHERIPGWEPNSVGIHSDDGQRFIEGNGMPEFCIPWNKENSVAGIGIIPTTGKLFFTLNGKFIGIICEFSTETAPILYPTIGISDRDKVGSQILIKMQPPFTFDWEKFVTDDFVENNSGKGAMSWGVSTHGSLGTGLQSGYNSTPVNIQQMSGVNIISSSCGSRHTVVVSDSGQLYTWGSNEMGQLGNSLMGGVRSCPQSIPMPVDVHFMKVAAGYRHTLALTDTGDVYSFGGNEDFCLGNISGTYNSTPTKLEVENTKFIDIAAGYNCSLALSDTGNLYYWGLWGRAVPVPKFIQGTSKFTSVAIGGEVGYALTKDGIIYSFKEGQRPNPIDCDAKFEAITANSFHLAAIEKEHGHLYSWSYGQLTSSPILSYRNPSASLNIIDSNNSRFQKVSAGWRFLVALKNDGSLYTFGNGKFLGQQDRTDQLETARPIEAFDDVIFTDIAAGEQHAFATFSRIDLPWQFPTELKGAQDWDVIGYGHNPPRKIMLEPLGLMKTAVGTEFQKVKNLFENHLHGKNFTIQNIYAIDNPNLENSFLSEISKLTHKWKESPHLFKKQDWKGRKHAERRSTVWEYFEKVVNDFDWNKKREVKAIPVVHGTSEAAVWNICKSGFSSLARLNEGWYGRGMYFTTHVPYAATYTSIDKKDTEKEETSTSIDKIDTEKEESEKNKEPTPQIFIISFAIPGSVFPVVEHPHKQGSFKGKPNQVGYQSHYVTVNSKGIPPKKGIGKYDELVLFQEGQVLPRYVVYAIPGRKNEEIVEVISEPTEVNRETFNKLIMRTKELLADTSLSEKLSYFDKKKINQLIKEVDEWRERNPTTQEVMTPYKKFVGVVSILNRTAKVIYDAKIAANEANENLVEDESASDEEDQTPEDQGEEIYQNNEDGENGDQNLWEQIRKLKEENKKLVAENSFLHRKVQWLEVLGVNNGTIKKPLNKEWGLKKSETQNNTSKKTI